MAKRFTRDAVVHEHVPPAAETERAIEHRFVAVEHEHRIGALVRELQAAEVERALVFVRTKRGADRLVKRLVQHDVEAVAMHGNKSQGQRERALDSFERGDVLALVATDVAARGIDVAGISHVINFDAPEDRESYVHRTGRTGRAGASGVATTFVEAGQAHDVGRLAHELRLHQEFERGGLRAPEPPRQAAPRAGGAQPRRRRRR